MLGGADSPVGKIAWKKPLRGSFPSTQDWSVTVSRLVGEQGVSLWRLDAEDLQPVPWAEPSVV